MGQTGQMGQLRTIDDAIMLRRDRQTGHVTGFKVSA